MRQGKIVLFRPDVIRVSGQNDIAVAVLQEDFTDGIEPLDKLTLNVRQHNFLQGQRPLR